MKYKPLPSDVKIRLIDDVSTGRDQGLGQTDRQTDRHRNLHGHMHVAVSLNDADVQVRETMRRFDLDRDGSISFYEFLRMLCCKPWGQLLPPEVTDCLSRGSS